MNASKVEESAKTRGFGQMDRLGESMLGNISYQRKRVKNAQLPLKTHRKKQKRRILFKG